MKLWIVAVGLLVTTSCSVEKPMRTKQLSRTGAQQGIQETDTIAVLSFKPNREAVGRLYDTMDTERKAVFANAKEAELNSRDLVLIDSLLRGAVEEHNDRIRKAGHPERVLKTKGYRRQYIPYPNASGEKIVWVNCFCSKHHEQWHTQIVSVFDGGRCYFNVWVDLVRRTWYAMEVNGEA